MNTAEQPAPLPFSLDEGAVGSVEVTYGIYSSKTGAGIEEVQLRAARVVLRRTASNQAPVQSLEGALPAGALVRLLQVMEDQRFAGIADQPSTHPSVRRIVKLTSPKLSKQVLVDGEGDGRFERVVGALLLTASLARPEVLGRRFFHLVGPL
jgi:hypothetical protein